MREATILQIVKIDDTGDSCYRMRWPARSLADANGGFRVVNLDAYAAERYAWAREADLLVLFQSLDPDMFSVIEERRARGLKTLVEYNDNFYSPQAWSPVAKDWESHKVWDVYERFMQIADGVIVTGQGLFELFSGVTQKPIYILPNHLPAKPRAASDYFKVKTHYPSFGWAGSLGHMADLLAATPIIKEVLEKVPGSKFHVMGNESIPHHLQIPSDRIVFTKWGTMDEYFTFWESLQVGFAPLLDTPYNQCRSDIKAVEMSSRGVAPVLCNAKAYAPFFEGAGISGVENFGQASTQIIKLLANSALREELALTCHGYVERSRIDTGSGKRTELYVSLLPKESSKYAWSFAPGYHEVTGTLQETAPSQEVLKRAQSLLRDKKGREALELILKESGRSPHAVELIVATLQLLRAAQDSRFSGMLQEVRLRFPKEVRLWVLYIQEAKDSELIVRWREFYTWLRAQPPAFIRSVGTEVCHAMSISLAQDMRLSETAEELLLFYPFAYQIRFQVAEALERAGRIWEARGHFETLCRAKREHELGSASLASLERGYLQAWYDAIDGRIKGDFR